MNYESTEIDIQTLLQHMKSLQNQYESVANAIKKEILQQEASAEDMVDLQHMYFVLQEKLYYITELSKQWADLEAEYPLTALEQEPDDDDTVIPSPEPSSDAPDFSNIVLKPISIENTTVPYLVQELLDGPASADTKEHVVLEPSVQEVQETSTLIQDVTNILQDVLHNYSDKELKKLIKKVTKASKEVRKEKDVKKKKKDKKKKPCTKCKVCIGPKCSKYRKVNKINL